MAMVGVDSGSLQADSQPKSSGLVLGRRTLGTVRHSSNEPGELSQWLCHEDSTINIDICIIITIIIIIITYHRLFVDGVEADDVNADFHFCRAIYVIHNVLIHDLHAALKRQKLHFPSITIRCNLSKS